MMKIEINGLNKGGTKWRIKRTSDNCLLETGTTQKGKQTDNLEQSGMIYGEYILDKPGREGGERNSNTKNMQLIQLS